MHTSSTPATRAGIAVCSTELGYTTAVPGTYSPTRAIGRTIWPRPSCSKDCIACASWRWW